MGKISQATKRTLAGILAGLMIFTSLPTNVLADELILDETVASDVLVDEVAGDELLTTEADVAVQDDLLVEEATDEIIADEPAITEEEADLLVPESTDPTLSQVSVHLGQGVTAKYAVSANNTDGAEGRLVFTDLTDDSIVTNSENYIYLSFNAAKGTLKVSSNTAATPTEPDSDIDNNAFQAKDKTDIYADAFTTITVKEPIENDSLGYKVNGTNVSVGIPETVKIGEPAKIEIAKENLDVANFHYAYVSVNGSILKSGSNVKYLDKEDIEFDYTVEDETVVSANIVRYQTRKVDFETAENVDKVVIFNDVVSTGSITAGTGINVVSAAAVEDITNRNVGTTKLTVKNANGYTKVSVSKNGVAVTQKDSKGNFVLGDISESDNNIKLCVKCEIDSNVEVSNVNPNTTMYIDSAKVKDGKIATDGSIEVVVSANKGYYFNNNNDITITNGTKTLDYTDVTSQLNAENTALVATITATDVKDFLEAKKNVTVSATTIQPEIEIDSATKNEAGVWEVDYDPEYNVGLAGTGVGSGTTVSFAGLNIKDGVSMNSTDGTVYSLSFNDASGKETVIGITPEKVNGQKGTAEVTAKIKVTNRVKTAAIATVQDPGTTVSQNLTFTGDTNSTDFSIGTKITYTISSNKSASDASSIISSIGWADPANHKTLNITTKTVSSNTDVAYITFYREDTKDGTKEIGKTTLKLGTTVNDAKVKLDAKSIKYTTDRYVALDLTTDKDLKGINNLYYVVKIDNQEKDASKQGTMLSINTITVAVDPGTGKPVVGPASSDLSNGNYVDSNNGYLYVTTTKEYDKEGTGAKFDYTVQLVQKNASETVNKSAVAELKAAKNAKPSPTATYATKISLTKKASKAYTDQPKVSLATVAFAKDVTYKEIAVVSGNTTLTQNVDYTYNYDTGVITLTKMPSIPDKYTYVVEYRPGADSNPVTAQMTVKVVQAIDEITLSAPANVYKAANKAVNVKINVTYNETSETKPATKKLVFELAAVDGKAPAAGQKLITVNKNNGAIAIKKDAKVKSVTVKATANDYANHDLSKTIVVNIKDKYDEIKDLRIVKDSKALSFNDAKKKVYSNTSSQVTGLKVQALVKAVSDNTTLSAADILDETKVTYKSSNTKIVTVSSNGELIAQGKLGKANIEAVTTDGGIKTKSKITVEVVANTTGLQLDLRNNTDQTIAAAVLSTNAKYRGIMTDAFRVNIVDKNLSSADEMTFLLSIKNGKVISKDTKSAWIQPTAAETVITLKYKEPGAKKQTAKVYTVTNTAFSKDSVKLNKQDGKLVTGYAKTPSAVSVNYALKSTVSSNAKIVLSYDAKIYLTGKDAVKDSYFALMSAINNSATLKDGNVYFTVDQSLATVPAGNYTLYVNFLDKTDMTKAFAKPIAIKVKVDKAAKSTAPKSITGSFSKALSTNSANVIDLDKSVAKKLKNVDVVSVELINAKTAKSVGGVNNFNKLFKLSTANSLKGIEVQSTTDLNKVDKNDLVGYLKITAKSAETGNSIDTIYIKVSVTLKK